MQISILLIFLLGLFAENFAMASKKHIQKRAVGSPRVAIVGGGLAGLAAARILQEKGVDYVLYEGSDWLGGRVRYTPYRSGFIQLGAQFINGEKNPMFEIATRLKLPLEEDEGDIFGDDSIFAFGQATVTRKDIKEFLTLATPMSAKFDRGEEKIETQSLAQVFRPAYEKWLQQNATRLAKRSIFDRLAKLFETFYETEWSGPFDRLAIKSFGQWDDYSDGSEYTLGSIGFKAILDDIKSHVNEANLRYNSVVQKIDYTGNQARLTVSSGNSNSQALFDYVIITVSLGHLKRFSSSLFTPSLPSLKQQAINNLGMGNMMKIHLEYDRDWWPKDVGNILTLPETKSGVQDTKSAIKETLRVFQPLEWESNILVCWLAGDGPSLISQVNDATLSTIMTERLREALVNQTIPAPKRILRMNWYSNPLFLGSYSYMTPEAAAMGDPYAILAQPVKNSASGKVQLLFAGEATHSNLWQTTSGAYLSGQREARRILKLEGL